VRLYLPRPYEKVLENIKVRHWTDGEVVHHIRKCECDKCKHILNLRVERRKKYMLERSPRDNLKATAYSKAMRSLAVSKGRPQHIQLGWCGSPWVDADYEFFLSVREYAKANSVSINELIKTLLKKEIKKGVRS
jgi:hypothetical protein